MNIASGKYVSNLSGTLEYKSFYPRSLFEVSKEIKLNEELKEYSIRAFEALGSFSMISEKVINSDVYLGMNVYKEALLSSQIEGTQATLDDVFNPTIDINQNLNVNDVINYVKAINYGVERIKTLPLSNKLFKELHKILLNNSRGQEKNPGEFRRSQNWIGNNALSIKEAKYVPPNIDDMNECMNDLEKYINESKDLNVLVRCALIHYQFETIHPFLDGNGRIGRLLSILYLIDQKCLENNSLYLSLYLKKYQDEYYKKLEEVRENGNYEGWIKFFLNIFEKACRDAEEKMCDLLILHYETYFKIAKPNLKINKLLFDYIEKHPILDIAKTSIDLDYSYNGIKKALLRFKSLGILELVDKKRGKVFVYKKYLDIISNDC